MTKGMLVAWLVGIVLLLGAAALDNGVVIMAAFASVLVTGAVIQVRRLQARSADRRSPAP